jgi:hypothetical protein
MRTTRRGRAALAVVVALDPGAARADTRGGCKHNPTSAGDTWSIGLWNRKGL